MKKLLFLTISFLTISIAADAQSGWAIGDKVAFGHSWTVGNRPVNSKRNFHPSVQLGRNAVYNFNDNVGLGFGTFFSTEGTSYKLSDGNKWEHRTNFIRVPVFAAFNFGDANKRVRPRLTIGPSIGFLVGGKSLVLNKDDEFLGIKATKVMDTKIDAGAAASLGFNVKVKEGIWFNHDINYYHGLVEQKLNANAVGDQATFTSRNLNMSMGFLINGQAMKSWKHKMHDGKGKWKHGRR